MTVIKETIEETEKTRIEEISAREEKVEEMKHLATVREEIRQKNQHSRRSSRKL